jgi:hypothetical protein
MFPVGIGRRVDDTAPKVSSATYTFEPLGRTSVAGGTERRQYRRHGVAAQVDDGDLAAEGITDVRLGAVRCDDDVLPGPSKAASTMVVSEVFVAVSMTSRPPTPRLAAQSRTGRLRAMA